LKDRTPIIPRITWPAPHPVTGVRRGGEAAVAATPSSKDRLSGFCIRSYTESDEESVLRLHERGFGRPWPAAFWRWRSRPVFGGDTCVMGAFAPDGRCVALMAGVQVPCTCRGEPATTISVSNAVLDPDLVPTLAGTRLFLRVVDGFIRTLRTGSVRLMYGAPVQSLVRAMSVHLGIEVLGDVYALVHHLKPMPTATTRPSAAIRVARESAVPDATDNLWRRCAGHRHSGIVRDRAFLAWRFAPRVQSQVDYECITARDASGDLRGLAVLRMGGWRDDVLSLCEWLVPPDDAATQAALLRHAKSATRQRGAAGLVAYFSANTVEFREWQAHHEFVVAPTSHQIVFKTFGCGLNRAALFDCWRFTMADLEFL